MKQKYNPLFELIAARVRQFFREPEAIFWTYGFPLLMVIGLGIAFRTKTEQIVPVAIVEGPRAEEVVTELSQAGHFEVQAVPAEEAARQLRHSKVAVVLAAGDDGVLEYRFDPSSPEGRAARAAVDDCLQRSGGRQDVLAVRDQEITIPGSRYVDFLVPGLIGLNLMGGGMWGIGFVLVDMRVRKLLRRLVATPMRRRDFLLSMVGARALFFIPEMLFLLIASWLIFDIAIRGSLLAVVSIGFVGALSFAGLGLLAACRAQRIETISGIMNLAMLPMWLMSGVFFSSERFPAVLQPFIQALPLTQVNNALRAVMLEGAALSSQLLPVTILAVWGGVSFWLALRWFRWT